MCGLYLRNCFLVIGKCLFDLELFLMGCEMMNGLCDGVIVVGWFVYVVCCCMLVGV